MNIAQASINRSTFVLFCTLVLFVGGLYSYSQLGQLEDPGYTIKRAVIVTPYPGAMPEEVEQEVSDRIENAVQQMGQLKRVRSLSREGLSVVYAEMQEHFSATEFPQIWDELRRKVGDVQSELPPGAGPSLVRDDFGNVFGVLLAVVGDGFEPAELRDYVEELRREILRVEDVSRVKTWGEQQEVVYLETSQARLAEVGIAPQVIFGTLAAQNKVRPAGHVELEDKRLALRPGGEFQAVEEIAGLTLRGPDGELLRLGDIAMVRRGYKEPPETMMRFNGRPAIALAVSTVEGGNVVRMGEALRVRLDELKADLPIGIEIGVVAYQSETVQEAVRGFLLNLVSAILIVLFTLLFFLGLRSGLIIGATLLLTIFATLIFMKVWGIDLQRVSLGAMIIALGMLVDNAIVVADGILVRRQQGMKPEEAAAETVQRTAWPLLGATFVAIFAFLAVYLSKNNTGEYTRSLFEVLAASLLISWVLAITLTPVLCQYFLKVAPAPEGGMPPGRLDRLYASTLKVALGRRGTALLVMAGLAVAGIVGIALVKKDFFPPSTRNQFLIDYWVPEGSSIHTVSADLGRMEERLLADRRVEDVASFIGSGPPRFNLVVEPELPFPTYGHVVVTVSDYREIPALITELREDFASRFPHAEPRLRLFPMGPSAKFEIEARFHGPDPGVLRSLSEQARAILEGDPHAQAVRDNWRQPVMLLSPRYDQARARRTMVSRTDMADSLRGAFDGLPVGLYREEDLLIPILMRLPEAERRNLENIGQMRVWSSATGRAYPLSQVSSRVEVQWQDPHIWRQDRQRVLTVQADPRVITSQQLHARIRADVEAIPLPPGYEMTWGGTFENTTEARAGLFGGIPISLLLMVLTVVALFNAVRQPLIIFGVLPLAAVGVALGLLLTGLPLGFMALLGLLSLSGLMIKNSVVLIDEMDAEIASGKPRHGAVLDASASRMRPILMAALTTVLGMIPLVFDTFFSAMAVAIMCGLLLATVLTLYAVPLLYMILFRIPEEAGD